MDPADQTAATVLVVDDERNIRRTLEIILKGQGYHVLSAESAEEAIARLSRSPVDLAIVDLQLPRMSGLELLDRLRKDDTTRHVAIIMISGHATVNDAVRALKLGAIDFFEKPLSRDRVLVCVANALAASRLARRVADLSAQLAADDRLTGASEAVAKVERAINTIAKTRTPVLVTGESGVGKAIVCRALHRRSLRSEGSFIRVPCGTLPKERMDRELFGVERRGGEAPQRGFFERAHGGTLVLDDVDDLTPRAQERVAEAIRQSAILRVGAEASFTVDVRIVATTRRPLTSEATTRRFRPELLGQLSGFVIGVPPLRERKEDLPLLVEALVLGASRERGLTPKAVDPSFLEGLGRRALPGNVRELKNLVERALLVAEDALTIADLPEDPHQDPFEEEDDSPRKERSVEGAPIGHPTLRAFRAESERAYIVEVLQHAEWNISRAANILGIERTNLHKKIRAHKIRRDDGSAADET